MLTIVRYTMILHTNGKSGTIQASSTFGLAMTVTELDAAMFALGWKAADLCRATGLHRNTPSRWRNDGVEIPAWVSQHLGLLLDLKRLHAAHALPVSPRGGGWYVQDLARLHDAYLKAPACADQAMAEGVENES